MWYGKSLFQIYNDVDRAFYESIRYKNAFETNGILIAYFIKNARTTSFHEQITQTDSAKKTDCTRVH